MAKGLQALSEAFGSKVIESTDPADKPSAGLLTGVAALDALKAVEKKLNSQYKTENSVTILGKRSNVYVPCMPTGLPSVDYGVLGIGGVPRGRIIEVFGPPSSGKTSWTLGLIAEEQKTGHLAAFVDAEHALDSSYAQSLGVDIDKLAISQPGSGEEALETVIELVDSGAVSLIIVDSVAALTPIAEINGEMGESHMGLQARMMSQAMRKLVGRTARQGVTVVFLNQIRNKIGVMYGSPETTTGGMALNFYASVRLDVRRVGGEAGSVTSGNVKLGHTVKIKCVKNKTSAPFRETEVTMIYGKGFDRFADTVKYAADCGAIEKAGAWFKFEGENIGQGLEKTILTLRDNPAMMEKVKEKIAEAIKAQREADKV